MSGGEQKRPGSIFERGAGDNAPTPCPV